MLASSADPHRLMKETYTFLHTALSLDGENFESKRLLIKNLLWLGKFDSTEKEKYLEEKLRHLAFQSLQKYGSPGVNHPVIVFAE